ncbi:MAG: PEP-CTERM sorting domain-containing protein [Planctomycetota bacterium]
MKTRLALAALAAGTTLTAHSTHAALVAGDLAFVGFNADGDDGFAVVALSDIAAGEEVYFRDEEWDGSAFGSGEGEILWTTPTITAGTVFFFDDVDGPSPGVTASNGAATGTIADTPLDGTDSGPGDFGISSSGETIFAFQGSSNTPTTFIAAFSSTEGIEDDIAGTGLTLGTTAIALTGISGDPDVAEYTGSRNSESAFGDYLALVNDVNNWTVLGDGSGDQSVPLSTTAFVIPEPASLGLLAVGGLLLAGRRRRSA